MVTRLLSFGAAVNTTVNGQFQLNPATTTGLTFGFKAGNFADGINEREVASGTVALTDNATNIVTISSSGAVSAAVQGAESGNSMYKVITASGVITSITDLRAGYK